MMNHAHNKQLSDKQFAEEVILAYTEPHQKRMNAEYNMLMKFRSCFKGGESYGMTLLDTIFPESEACSREELFRQRIELERKMNDLDEKINHCMKSIQKEKAEIQEAFYDCQSELFQQKEYVKVLQKDDEERTERMRRQIKKIRDCIHQTSDELVEIDRAISTSSPLESKHLKERKHILLKQNQTYHELLRFMM